MSSEPSLNRCPTCDEQLASTTTERFCPECGSIRTQDRFERTPKPHFRSKTKDGESTKRRSPTKSTHHDNNLGTQIGYWRENRDINGNTISGKKLIRLRRQQKYHHKAFHSRREGSRNLAYREINRIISAIGAPHDLEQQACLLFKQAQENDLITGYSIEGMSGAVVYATIRINRHSHELRDIAAVSQLTPTNTALNRIRKCYNCINSPEGLGLPTPPPAPTEQLEWVATQLDCPGFVSELAYDILQETPTQKLVGKQAKTVAAAAIYLASQVHSGFYSQQQISDATGVHQKSIRNIIFQSLTTDDFDDQIHLSTETINKSDLWI